MQIQSWLKPAIYGGIVGAAIFGIVGFGWGGWVTGAKANVMASELAQEKLIAALVPICVSNAVSDPESVTKISELKSASSYQRTKMLSATGWATMLGSTEPNDALSKACAIELTK